MSCVVRDGEGNAVGFACSRGSRHKRTCAYCKVREATLLCDEPLRGARAGKTCSGALCVGCATQVDVNVHVCPPHRREREQRAQKAADADAWLSQLIAEEGAPVVTMPVEPDPPSAADIIEHDRRQRAAVPIAEKVAHVRGAGQTREHHCHWPGCDERVPPAMWGCRKHWYKLPQDIRDRIWNAYAPGQENTMSPSQAYLEAARDAQEWIERNTGVSSFQRAVDRARLREKSRRGDW